MLSRCVREKSNRKAIERSPRFLQLVQDSCNEIFLSRCITRCIRSPAEHEGGKEEERRARAAFSCGGGKSSRSQRCDRIAVDVPLSPSTTSSKLPSATPSPAAILIGAPPTSRPSPSIPPLPPPSPPAYQRRSATLPRLFAVPFASTPFHPGFDGIRGKDFPWMEKLFLQNFCPPPSREFLRDSS